MKPKPKKKPLVKPISEERILLLMRDMDQNIRSGSVEEWRCVARHWHTKQRLFFEKLAAIRPSIGALITGMDLLALGHKELKTWLAQQTPEDP